MATIKIPGIISKMFQNSETVKFLESLEIRQVYDYFNPLLAVERGLLRFKPDEAVIRFEAPVSVREFTAAGFVKGVNKFVGMLRNLGVQRRQIVAFSSDDIAMNILGAAGTIKHGAVFLPIDKIDVEILESSKARILFCGLEEGLAQAERLKTLKELWQVVVFAQVPCLPATPPAILVESGGGPASPIHLEDDSARQSADGGLPEAAGGRGRQALKLPPGWFPFTEYYPAAEEFAEFPPTNTMSGIFYTNQEINCWSFILSLHALLDSKSEIKVGGKRASIAVSLAGLAASRKVLVGKAEIDGFVDSMMMLVSARQNEFYDLHGGEVVFKTVHPTKKTGQ